MEEVPMVEKPAGLRRFGAAAPLLALVGALAFTAAGCGGKSADQKASETYANSVCSAIADWETQVKSIATDLSGGISKTSLQSKVTQVESATKSLATDIKAVPPPDTSDGQAAKQQLNQLSTELQTTVTAAQSAVTGIQADASAATIGAAAVALAPQVKTLATSAQSTISTLQSSKGDISSAFKSADSCKSLGGSS
jgi:hypothetical protein